jgi:cysteine dioxygenase
MFPPGGIVLCELIDDLRCTPPLDRGAADMAVLLSVARLGAANLSRELVARPKNYTRTLLYAEERFEVLLLNWSPGSASPVHDHGDQYCWLVVLEGRLEVDDYARIDAGEIPGYARIEARGSRTLEPGGLDLRSGRFDLHRVTATADAPAVSLHVYSAPMRNFLVYDESTRRCDVASGTYDAVLPTYD